jgi:hypothetical protein
VLDGPVSRETALRIPWLVAGIGTLLMLLMVWTLTTERLESIRAAGREPTSGAAEVEAR